METRRFYTSPVNHENLEEWDRLGPRMEKAVHESCPGVSVDVGTGPVFGCGIDAEDALERVRRLRFSSRNVRVDLWSAIVFYETVCITFGSGLTEPERLEIARRLERDELSGQALLREIEGPYDEEAIQVYGYSFLEERGKADEEAFEHLLDPFGGPLYIGERRCLSNEDGQIEEGSFELFFEEKDVAVFTALDPEAERRLWKSTGHGGSEGLIALFAGDPADRALVGRFSELADLRILLAEEPSAGMRVTLGRCHVDDLLVVVYTPSDEPYLDQPLVFAI